MEPVGEDCGEIGVDALGHCLNACIVHRCWRWVVYCSFAFMTATGGTVEVVSSLACNGSFCSKL